MARPSRFKEHLSETDLPGDRSKESAKSSSKTTRRAFDNILGNKHHLLPSTPRANPRFRKRLKDLSSRMRSMGNRSIRSIRRWKSSTKKHIQTHISEKCNNLHIRLPKSSSFPSFDKLKSERRRADVGNTLTAYISEKHDGSRTSSTVDKTKSRLHNVPSHRNRLSRSSSMSSLKKNTTTKPKDSKHRKSNNDRTSIVISKTKSPSTLLSFYKRRQRAYLSKSKTTTTTTTTTKSKNAKHRKSNGSNTKKETTTDPDVEFLQLYIELLVMRNFPLSRWEIGCKVPPYEKGPPLAPIPEMESVTTSFVLTTDGSDDGKHQPNTTTSTTTSTIRTAAKHSRNFQRTKFPRRWKWTR